MWKPRVPVPTEEADVSDDNQTVDRTQDTENDHSIIGGTLSPTITPGEPTTPAAPTEVPTDMTFTGDREDLERIPVPRVTGDTVDVRSVTTGEQSQVHVPPDTPVENDICGGFVMVLGMGTTGKQRYVCRQRVEIHCSLCSIALCRDHAVENKEKPDTLICDTCENRMVASQQFSDTSTRGFHTLENNEMHDVLALQLTRRCAGCAEMKHITVMCLHEALDRVEVAPVMFCENCIASGHLCPICRPAPPLGRKSNIQDTDQNEFKAVRPS